MERPVCRECHKAVPAKGGNTSNLFSHLREHHPTLFACLTPAAAKKRESSVTQQTIESSFARGTKVSRDSPQHKELTHAIAYHIGKDGVPLSTVERPGFKHMIHKRNPKYDLLSRKYFSNEAIPRLYTGVRSQILSDMKDISHYSLTTDLWTSCATEPYITITLHYIDSAWNLKSYCLQTVALMKDHTGQNIAECVTEVLEEWKLNPQNLVAATTDNGLNVVSAFEILELLRISCFSHNLDLGVKKALNDTRCVQRALSRCHSVVSVFSRSWKKTRDLKEKQTQLDLPQHKLKQDVITRWGSTYQMVAQILEQQQAICAVLADDRKTWNNMPTDEEVSTLEVVKEVLENVFYLTDALAAEKEVTASSICCILAHLRNKLGAKEGDKKLAIDMKNIMLTDLNNRYSQPQVIQALEMCSFLDPRFKTQYLGNKEATVELIKEECLANCSLQEEHQSSTVRVEEFHPVSPPTNKRKGLSAILKHIEEESQVPVLVTVQDKIDNEVISYLEYPKVNAETDPLVWWKSEQRRFPDLSFLARKYLCICGTSVPSEQMFSTCGYIVNNHRSRLHPKNVNYLTFLSRNIQ